MMTDGTDIKDTNIIDTRTGDLWGYQLGTNGYPSGGGSVTRHYSPTAAQFAAMPTDPNGPARRAHRPVEQADPGAA